MFYPVDKAMAPEQRELLNACARLWKAYAPLSWERDVDLAGGMQWRVVNGVSYLSRFRPDPEGRSRKLTKSLGRRSTDTERLHAAFHVRREEVDRDLDALAPRITLAARAARSMSVARLGRSDAERIHRLRRAGLLDASDPVLLPLGAPAIVAYEALYGTLAKGNVVQNKDGDDALMLYVRRSGTIDVGLAQRVARALFTSKATVTVQANGSGGYAVFTEDLSGTRYREIELVGREALHWALQDRSALEGMVREVVEALDDMPPRFAAVPALNGTIQGYPVPDPRAYAMTCRLLAGSGSRPDLDDLPSFRRASFVAWSIRGGVIGPAFTDGQEETLSALGYPNVLLGDNQSFDAGDEEKRRDDRSLLGGPR